MGDKEDALLFVCGAGTLRCAGVLALQRRAHGCARRDLTRTAVARRACDALRARVATRLRRSTPCRAASRGAPRGHRTWAGVLSGIELARAHRRAGAPPLRVLGCCFVHATPAPLTMSIAGVISREPCFFF